MSLDAHIQGPNVRKAEHELVEAVLFSFDAVHHEVLVETCLFDLMSATTTNYVNKKTEP